MSENACVSPSGNHCIHYDLDEDCCFCGKKEFVRNRVHSNSVNVP